jgi:predicted ATP-binding protein involved in virulence
MWIERLSLKNFRGFRALELDLNRRLTLLIGENGSGKSSIVDALAAVGMIPHGLFRRLALSDVRVGAASLRVEAKDAEGNWSFEYERGPSYAESSPEGASGTRVLAMPTSRGRLLAEGREHAVRGKPNHASTQEWFRKREDLENEIRVRTRNLDAEDDALALVRRALGALVPGFSNPRVERDYFPGKARLVLDKAGTSLSSDMLSAGEKSLLALGVEIARFLSAFRDDDVPISERSATIVIDEIELHLHPRWQRVVVPRLLAAFPGCQFIITTHSPQVIGSVDAESLFILEDFQVHPANYPTKGRDSNAVLEELMGASARDPDTEDELQAAARLVEVGSEDEAEAAVQKLAERFGEDDREVVRLRTALMLRGA